MSESEILLKRRTARLSVISNFVLVLCKLIVGLLTGTVSIISEAIHSGVDLMASTISFMAVRKSSEPPDEAHDYGHGKVENVSAAAESLLIIAVGIFILIGAASKFSAPQLPQSLDLAIGVMVVSSALNAAVSYRMYCIGKQTGSAALQAESLHLRTDVWTSIAVLTGIVLMKITGFLWIDPAIACCVAVGIMRAGYHMGRNSYNTLIDTSLSVADEDTIGHIITSVPGVIGYHHLRTRKAGEVTVMDFHLEMDKDLPLEKAHAIATQVEKNLREQVGPCDPTIHLEPR